MICSSSLAARSLPPRREQMLVRSFEVATKRTRIGTSVTDRGRHAAAQTQRTAITLYRSSSKFQMGSTQYSINTVMRHHHHQTRRSTYAQNIAWHISDVTTDRSQQKNIHTNSHCPLQMATAETSRARVLIIFVDMRSQLLKSHVMRFSL